MFLYILSSIPLGALPPKNLRDISIAASSLYKLNSEQDRADATLRVQFVSCRIISTFYVFIFWSLGHKSPPSTPFAERFIRASVLRYIAVPNAPGNSMGSAWTKSLSRVQRDDCPDSCTFSSSRHVTLYGLFELFYHYCGSSKAS